MLWFNFTVGLIFYLFLCLVTYDNEYKAEESKKVNHNITRKLIRKPNSQEPSNESSQNGLQ